MTYSYSFLQKRFYTNYESKWQIWRNGGWDGPELTLRFEVVASGESSRRPNAPTLTGPGDWGVYYGNTGITLRAQHNGHPDGHAITHYYFEIFESAQNANSGWITSNSWSPQGLGFNGYQWRAKVRDQNEVESNWSPQVWRFGVLNNEPEIYQFYHLPCRPAWGNSEQICFCADTNAGTIKLQVNSATDGSDRGEWQVLNELGTTSYNCNNDNDRPPTWTQLEYETGRHLVRLYARRDGGWAAAAHRDIVIELPANRRPDSPLPRLPERRSYVNSRTITFEWDRTLRTTHYRLRVSTDPNFSTLLFEQTLPVDTPHYTHTFSEDHPIVYWRVTSFGPYGEHDNGSQFHIDRTPPQSSMTALPEVTGDSQFTVQWNAEDSQSGVNWHHIQVRDGTRPDSQWVDWLINTTKISEIFHGQPGHTYHFRARAMDQVGNWEPWPQGNGHTYTRIDLSSAESVWWNHDYQYKRNLLILNNHSNSMPTGYPVLLRFDESTNPTALELYQASQSVVKGADLRIVHNNESAIDSFVRIFHPVEIEIWFATQASISGNQSSSGIYQLYYGNPDADFRPMNINDIFLPRADVNTVGLWHFQEGSGNTVHDSSGESQHGTFANGGWVRGLHGGAGAFNGSNSTVTANPGSRLNNMTAFTVEAWVYLTDQGHKQIVVKGTDRELNLIRFCGQSVKS